MVDAPIAVAVAGVTLAIALFFAPRGYQAGFVDMAHDGYQLRQVLDLSGGGVIFRDTFDQYGAAGGYLNTLGFVALGRRLLAVKYFVSGWYAAIAVLMFVLARQWLDPVLAGFSVLVWVGLAPFYQHGIMISPHVYVLCFQTLAAIVAVRTPSLDPRRFALVGALTGLSWAAKQSMGALFFGGVIAYLAFRFVFDGPARRRHAWIAALGATAGCAAVVAATLALLWMAGALGDWYRQTIVFPRDFYLAQSAPSAIARGAAARLARIAALVPEFVRMQLAQPPYWLLIRGVVIAAGLLQLRRRTDDRLTLMAAITAALWLGAYPSANFMHQWWTASLTIPPFVWCAQQLAGRVTREAWLRSAGTMALVLVVVGAGMLDRKRATTFRASALTETFVDPPILRGVRTDLPMKRAFDALYGVMARYRTRHPGAKIVAIDSADGFWTGINESLIFLSAFDDNPHAQPVYWNLPVLSTTVYPQYADRLWRDIRAEHPLLIEHRTGPYKPQPPSAYVPLAAVQSDFGYWYVYAPEHADRLAHGETSIFLARDGAADAGFAERGVAPNVDSGLDPNAEGAARGARAVDGRAVNVYTWPADLPLPDAPTPIDSVAAPVARAKMVRGDGDAWRVDGNAGGRFDPLLDFAERDLAPGDTLVARGAVEEGGFQVGFIQRDQWIGFVTVTAPGSFEAVLRIQRAGRYRLALANCIADSPWQTARRHWFRGTLGILTGGFLPNRFVVRQLGWARVR